MKSALPFILIFCLSIFSTVHAQSIDIPSKENTQLIEVSSRQFSPVRLAKVANDTIFPEIFSDPCSNNVTSYTTGENSGFLIGTNQYLDLEKAQKFTIDSSEDVFINEVLVAFDRYDSTIVDQKLAINIYAGLPDDGTSFGEKLGTSDSVRIGDIAVDNQSIQFTSFTFPEPVQITDNEFFASVSLWDVYSSPETGHIGILNTEDGCGNGSNVYELYPSSDTTLSWNTVLENWQGINVEILMGVIFEYSEGTSVTHPSYNYQLEVFPNPAGDQIQLAFDLPSTGTYQANLFTMTGKLVRETTLNPLQNTLTWPVHELPNGMYMYQVIGNEGSQSGKVVIRK